MPGVINSLNGFPVANNSPDVLSGAYHDPVVDQIYADRANQVNSGNECELEQITELYKVFVRAGGLFKPAMDPEARYSQTVAAFIGDTACFITKAATRRAIAFAEYARMIADDVEADRVKAIYGTDRLAAVSLLSTMEPHEVFQMWLVNAGVDDICRTLQLYVGKVQ